MKNYEVYAWGTPDLTTYQFDFAYLDGRGNAQRECLFDLIEFEQWLKDNGHFEFDYKITKGNEIDVEDGSYTCIAEFLMDAPTGFIHECAVKYHEYLLTVQPQLI